MSSAGRYYAGDRDVPGRRRCTTGGATAVGGPPAGSPNGSASADGATDPATPSGPRTAACLRAGAALHSRRAVPADVGRGVPRACSLWADDGGSGAGGAEQLVAGRGTDAGRARRGRASGTADRPLYLRFVQEQLTRAEVAAWRREDRPRLRGKARFAAVGVLARLIDALVRLSLLVRGRVPGGPRRGGAPARAQRCSRRPASTPDRAGTVRTYYGRVLRTAGYTVLQYWYFYPFNDWRSTFYGVNDHEADWETIVGLPGRPTTTAACARPGSRRRRTTSPVPDLRRRWDDPQLRREGDHPVVYPGAGSHSGRLPARRLRRLRRAARAAPGRRLAPARPQAAAALDRGAGPGRVRDPVRRLRAR